MKEAITERIRFIWSRFADLKPEIKWLLLLVLTSVAVFTRFAIRPVQQKPADEVIKIGAILPQTGAGAVFAQYIQEGSDLAVEEINASQKRKISILYEDSKNLPREGITAYNKLLVTEHPAVVMVALSSVARALAPLASQSGTAQVYVAVAIPDITDGKYTFRVYPEASGMAGVMARFSAHNLNATRAAIFYVNDDYGRVSLDAYRQQFELSGGSVVFAESYELQETDFRSQISKLQSLSPGPDVIYLSGYGPAYGVAVRQFKEQKVSSIITADMTMGLPNTREQVGSAGEDVYFVDGNVSATFANRFRQKYQKEPSSYAGYSYDIVHLLNRVAQTSPEFTSDSVRDGLLAVKDYQGAMGKITIKPNGDSALQFVVKKITDNVDQVLPDSQR